MTQCLAVFWLSVSCLLLPDTNYVLYYVLVLQINLDYIIIIISPASGWVGWGGISSISLTFKLTHKCLLTGVSLVVADQQALGIGVSLVWS